jgi:hypothetical protein
MAADTGLVGGEPRGALVEQPAQVAIHTFGGCGQSHPACGAGGFTLVATRVGWWPRTSVVPPGPSIGWEGRPATRSPEPQRLRQDVDRVQRMRWRVPRLVGGRRALLFNRRDAVRSPSLYRKAARRCSNKSPHGDVIGMQELSRFGSSGFMSKLRYNKAIHVPDIIIVVECQWRVATLHYDACLQGLSLRYINDGEI